MQPCLRCSALRRTIQHVSSFLAVSRRRTSPASAVLLAALAIPLGLTGCTSSGSCLDYAAPAPIVTRAADADFAAVVTFTSTGNTVELGAVYPVHEAHIVRVLHGTPPRSRILVTVQPGDCVTSGQPASYENGDPLNSRHRQLLLLSGKPEHGVYGVPPWSVEPLTSDGQLPFSTPTATAKPR